MSATAEDYRIALTAQIQQARQQNQGVLEISAGDLHRQVGGYPGSNHRMPTCCYVMRQTMKEGDIEVESPPKGHGASLCVQYKIRGS